MEKEVHSIFTILLQLFDDFLTKREIQYCYHHDEKIHIKKKMCKGEIPMKKRIAGLILMMSCLPASVLAKDIAPSMIVPNNYERLEAALMEETKEGKTLKDVAGNTPSTYDYHFESSDGKSIIIADNVPVTLPEGDEIPAYHVNCGGIPQKLADRLYDYFFPNGAYEYVGTGETKESLEQFIQEMEDDLERLKTEESSFSEEEKQEKIIRMEVMIKEEKERLSEAPAESTLRIEPIDSTYVDTTGYTYEGTEVSQTLYAMSADQLQHLSINSHDAKSVGWPTVRYFDGSSYNYSGVWGTPVRHCSNDEIRNIGISQEDATDIIKEFVDQMGFQWDIKDIMCVKGWRAGDESVEDNDYAEADHYTAFKFVMKPCAGGIPNAVTSSRRLPDQLDESYRVWSYEMINIVVEPDRIVCLEWDFPLTVEDKISENVGIISFEDASDIFEQIMPMLINDDVERREYAEVNAFVTNVNLELMRVRKSDADRTGMLIPTWVFYGDYNYHNIYEDGTEYWGEEAQPWILLAIDAVDGSIIDIVEGY